MRTATVSTIASKEVRDAFRNKWFVLYAATFVLLALGLSWLGLAGSGYAGMSGFGRTSATLINLVLLVMPLMALTVGALSITGERERGTLATILAQPLTTRELLVGKWLGLAVALSATVVIGFGLPAIVMAVAGSDQGVGSYLGLAGLSLLVGLAALAIGMLLSSAVPSTSVAIGLAIGLWLLLVFIGDIGLLGAGVAMRLDTAPLLTIALVNPLTDFRIAAMTTVGLPADSFGPAGVLLSSRLGGLTMPVLTAVLLFWAVVPLVISQLVLRRKEAL